MSNPEKEKYSYLDSCHPVILESNNQEFRYFGKGSSFFVSTHENIYWITAKHVLENLGASPEFLRITSSLQSRISIPFNTRCVIETSDSVLDDLYILKVDATRFDEHGDMPLISQNILKYSKDPSNLSPNTELMAVGFPDEFFEINYASQEITYKLTPIIGHLIGCLDTHYTYQFSIKNPDAIKSISGMSGGPVFFMEEIHQSDGRVLVPKLAGISIRATKDRLTFISSVALLEVIAISENPR